jgi:hypothetical protein
LPVDRGDGRIESIDLIEMKAQEEANSPSAKMCHTGFQ